MLSPVVHEVTTWIKRVKDTVLTDCTVVYKRFGMHHRREAMLAGRSGRIE
jgi:hypothetical protein